MPRGNEGEDDLSPGRRRFLGLLVATMSGLVGLAASVPLVAFFVTPPRRKVRDVWRRVGRVEAFQIGATVTVELLDAAVVPWSGFAAESAALLRRTGAETFVAFSPYCTHVGCPVRWDEGSTLFLCPCHGGAYYADGTVAAGPPPRPLVKHEVRVRDGWVEVLTQSIPMPG